MNLNASKFLFLLSLFFSADLLGESIASIRVTPIEEQDFVISTIPIKPGVEWRESSRDVIRRFLEATNRYRSNSVNWNSRDRVLEIDVQAFEYFSTVEWPSDKPPNASEIENQCLSTREDSLMSQERINQISSCVLERVRGLGFLDAQVLLLPKGQILQVDLHRHDLYKIGQIRFDKNEKIKSSRLLISLTNRVGKAFRPYLTQQDTQKIREIYIDAGFYNAQILPPSIEVKPSSRSVDLTWKIREGERTDIEIIGDSKSRKLMRHLKEAEDSYPEWFLDELAEDVKIQSVQRGFLECKVEKLIRETPQGVRKVQLIVHRGQQYRLTEPLLMGLSDPDSVLKIYDRISSFRAGRAFNEEKFRKAFEDDFFRELVSGGYTDVHVRDLEFSIDRKSGKVQPIITMNEGKRVLVKFVTFVGIQDYEEIPEAREYRKSLALNRPYNSLVVEEREKILLQVLRERGYLDVKIDRSVDEGEEGLGVNVSVTLGPRYRIAETVVRGLVRTDTKVITREFAFKTGDYYSGTDVNETISNILRLGITRSVDVRVFEKIPESGTVYLLVDVVEASRFRFEFGPGYGTLDGVRGVFRGTYANIGGTGRRLTFYAKGSRKLESERIPTNVIGIDDNGVQTSPKDVESIPFIERRMSLEFFEPSILSWPLDGRVLFSHEKLSRPQYAVRNYAVTNALDWRINRHLTYTPSYKVEFTDPFNIKRAEETIAIDDPASKRLHSFGQSLSLLFLDDTFNPLKGIKARSAFDLYDARFGSQLSFWILQNNQTFFYPLWNFSGKKSLGFAFSLNEGFSKSYADTEGVPVDKRFRLGGESTVRGYNEDAIQPTGASGEPIRQGGRSAIWFQTEINVPVVWDIDVLTFFDGGNIFDTNVDWDPTELDRFRFGTGVGLRYNSPVGPLKFGYAFVIDRRPGEDIGQIYFGVGPL